MKRLITLLILLIIRQITFAGNTPSGGYDFTVTNANGQQHSLSEYQGKKIAIVILPVTTTGDDSATLVKLDSIAFANSGTLQVIAVPSYEDGYTDDMQGNLLTFWQQVLDSSILISQPLYTHKATQGQQDSLFFWMTHVEQNTHFDNEVSGAGSMFLIDEQGNLTGVFEPGALFKTRLLNRIFPATNQ